MNSKLLIIDDDEISRQYVGNLLLKEGYEIEFAWDGEDGLRLAESMLPDLILLDVMLPGADGYEVCRKLRRHPVLSEVPVLMLTALNDQRSLLMGLEAGADDFITKPWDRDIFRARVRSITRLNRYRRHLAWQRRLEALLNEAQEGFLLLNATGNITYANQKAQRLLGLVGTGLSPGPKLTDCLQNAFFRVDSPPSPPPIIHADYFLLRPESIAARALWLAVRELGAPDGIAVGDQILKITDITAEVHRQASLWSFQAMVHHKLRTPLGAVFGGLQLMQFALQDATVRDINDLVQQALSGVRRLQTAVGDILKFATTSDGPDENAPSSARELLEICRNALFIHHLDDPLVDSDCPPETILRPGRRVLETVITELVENAVKFHPTKRPTVGIRLRAPDSSGTASMIMIDDGVHIAPEELEKLAQPYYQSEKKFTGETPGMGLGLSLVAMLLRNAGGTLILQNRGDRPGLRVELRLPADVHAGAS